MNLNERVLSVMGCKFVNDVLLDAPFDLTEDIIASLNISVVVHGTEYTDDSEKSLQYEIPRKLGIYKQIKSERTLQVTEIVRRIQANRNTYEKKFKDKVQKEKDYYKERYNAQRERN